MLKELQVKNFAIIDDARLRFQKGLNILTGETGAGKTLIIEAINLLIGERAANDLIRDSEDKLLVQGYFDFKDNPTQGNPGAPMMPGEHPFKKGGSGPHPFKKY